jgi:hypothetical protein
MEPAKDVSGALARIQFWIEMPVKGNNIIGEISPDCLS